MELKKIASELSRSRVTSMKLLDGAAVFTIDGGRWFEITDDTLIYSDGENTMQILYKNIIDFNIYTYDDDKDTFFIRTNFGVVFQFEVKIEKEVE